MSILGKALDDLYESCMNVGWDGTPPDVYVAQLLVDAQRVLMLVPAPYEQASQRTGDEPV